MSPSVSIITPCYNAADTLPGTVASILAQDFDDWELLLVDELGFIFVWNIYTEKCLKCQRLVNSAG